MPQHPELHRPATVDTAVAVPPIVVPGPRRPVDRTAPGAQRSWQLRYSRAATATDALVVVCVVTAGIGTGLGRGAAADRALLFSGVVAGLLVLAALAAFQAWEPRVLGTGTEEYRRLFRAGTAAVVALGLFSLATEIHSVRVWVFAFVPLACACCALGRQVLRMHLHRQRRAQRCMLRVLAVGTAADVGELVDRTRRDPGFGWQVVAACTPTGCGPDGEPTVRDVPVVDDLDGVIAATHTTGFDVVAVVPAPGWGPGRLHQLSWDLEGTGATLAVDPGVMEIAGPRLHIAPVDGMPLLRLTKPRFTGGARLVKDAVDRVLAAGLLVVLSPLLLAVVVALLACGHPVLVRRDRIGLNGAPFRVLTFHVEPGTRLGAVLRRWSIAALPQLLNVLSGSMSLVGPRPACPAAVAEYEDDDRRTLLVRPGLTGPWQTAPWTGQRRPTWDESARLDLRYVEEWSLTTDVAIMWRTVRAVATGRAPARSGRQPA